MRLKGAKQPALYILDKEYICEVLTKQRGFGLGELISEDITKFAYTACLVPNSQSLVIRVFLHFLAQGGYLHMRDLFSAFRETKEVYVLLTAVFSLSNSNSR